MNYVVVRYAGIELEMSEALAAQWPFELPLSKFPTFCGIGHGVGDALVPDTIFGARLCPACLIHDFDWAYVNNTRQEFLVTNKRLLKNLISCVNFQLYGSELGLAKVVVYGYYVAVSTIGWLRFKFPTILSTNTLKTTSIESKILLLGYAKRDYLTTSGVSLAKVI